MNVTLARSHLRLLPLAFGVLVLALSAGIFTLGARSAAAQNADSDGDGYADELEEELGSNFTDPDSTPEHFALLWTCTDGNDNDRDGMRDFIDPGCRNTAPGSTPTPAPTPVPTPPPGGSGGGTGGGSGGGSGGGGSSGAGGGDNAVFGGGGAPIGDGTSGGGFSGSGAGSETGSGDGQGLGDGSEATDASAADAEGGAGSGDKNASIESGSDDGGGFPWMLSLLILFGGLALAAIAYALAAHRRVRSVHGAPNRY